MPELEVRVRGSGSVTVPAYGIADAEHLVEKEIRRAWPDAEVRILRAERPGDARIVEEFTIHYQIVSTIRTEADSADDARRSAFRRARAFLADTRYGRTAWEALP